MSGPLIPYIKIPEIPLGLPKPFNSIKPFGVLVASAVYIGSIIAVRRATQRGLSADKMNSFILYVVGIGFIGAHVLDAIFYTPEKVIADPTYLIRFWDGLSSFGGFIGAITGVFVFKWRKNERDVMPYMDTVCSAFPLSWVIGRAGCATVHDHPGRETASWMGVQYPEFHTDVMIKSKEFGLLYDPTLTMGRFDLGLTEMVLAIPLAVTFMILWQVKPRNYGFWAGWQCIAYAPVRFVLDFLRVGSTGAHEGDPRYLGLTPAQYACFGFVAIGVIVLKMSKRYPAPATWAEQRAINAENEEIERLAAEMEEEEADRPRKKGAAPVAAKKKVVAEKQRRVKRADDDAKVEDEKAQPDDSEEARPERESEPPAAEDAPPPPKKKKKKKPDVEKSEPKEDDE